MAVLFFLLFGVLNVHSASAINYGIDKIANISNCNGNLPVFWCGSVPLKFRYSDQHLSSEIRVIVQEATRGILKQGFSTANSFNSPFGIENEIIHNVGNLANYVFNPGKLSADFPILDYSNQASLRQREVPLPAAIWLFGSAITGFVLFSARRKV
jgi:hypothetical protein